MFWVIAISIAVSSGAGFYLTLRPSIRTVHAAQKLDPQPNTVPHSRIEHAVPHLTAAWMGTR
jgi:hypothetical protein